MDLRLPVLLQAVRLSVERPKDGARQILNLHLTVAEAGIGLALMAVISTLMAEFGNKIAAVPAEPMVMADFATPFGLALLQLVVMSSAAVMIRVLGRWAGGKGDFAGALVLVGWLQAILLLLQFVQLVMIVLAPALVGPIGLFGLALFGWLLTNFIAELHGFQSLAKVFLCILAALLGVSLLLAIVLVFGFGVRM